MFFNSKIWVTFSELIDNIHDYVYTGTEGEDEEE